LSRYICYALRRIRSIHDNTAYKAECLGLLPNRQCPQKTPCYESVITGRVIYAYCKTCASRRIFTRPLATKESPCLGCKRMTVWFASSPRWWLDCGDLALSRDRNFSSLLLSPLSNNRLFPIFIFIPFAGPALHSYNIHRVEAVNCLRRKGVCRQDCHPLHWVDTVSIPGPVIRLVLLFHWSFFIFFFAHSSLVPFFLSCYFLVPWIIRFYLTPLILVVNFPKDQAPIRKAYTGTCVDVTYFKLQLHCNVFFVMDSRELFAYPFIIWFTYTLPLAVVGAAVVQFL